MKISTKFLQNVLNLYGNELFSDLHSVKDRISTRLTQVALKNLISNLSALKPWALPILPSLVLPTAWADSLYFQNNITQYLLDLDIGSVQQLNNTLNTIRGGGCNADANVSQIAFHYESIYNWSINQDLSYVAQFFRGQHETNNSYLENCITNLVNTALADYNEEMNHNTKLLLESVLPTVFGSAAIITGAVFLYIKRDDIRQLLSRINFNQTAADSTDLERQPLLGAHSHTVAQDQIMPTIGAEVPAVSINSEVAAATNTVAANLPFFAEKKALVEPIVKLSNHEKLMLRGFTNREIESDPLFKQCLCPINKTIMDDPVSLSETGQTYERTAIKKWLENNTTCPITRKPIKSKDFVTNVALKNIIEEFINNAAKKIDNIPKADDTSKIITNKRHSIG